MRFESHTRHHSGHSSFSSAGYNNGALNKGPGFRRVFSDIAMIAFWGAMIPGFLWIGNAAGF